MLTLRPYQEQAKIAVYEHLRTRDDNPCVVIPTGGGKTPLLASICTEAVTRWNGRVIVLAHVEELLQQSVDKLQRTCGELDVGVYSAGLGRRDTGRAVTVAGIQSVYKRACELPPLDLAIVDEAQMIPAEGEGMYRKFLAEAKIVNPELRVIGMTATPFRLKSGPICTPNSILNHVCYEVGIRELIRDGFLSPLISKAGSEKADTSRLHVQAGEFVAGEVEGLMDQDDLVKSACAEIVQYTADRNATLIFATGVNHGRHVVRVLREKHGVECGFICAKTSSNERDELIKRFKAGSLKYLCNINVLTLGFDAPNVDCVALLRPTMSTGLYYQMVGRGFRLHPGKDDCLVLDFGGNVLRHGPVDQLCIGQFDRGKGESPAKECPECQSLIATGFATCPQCGYKFPPPQRSMHEAKASEAGVLSGKVTTKKFTVEEVLFSVHTKHGASDDHPKTLRVDYRVGWHQCKSEWVCFEHDGYAQQKAIDWWRRRSPDPVPGTAQEAVDIIDGGGLAQTHSITVRDVDGEGFERIIDHELGPKPEVIPLTGFDDHAADEIPF